MRGKEANAGSLRVLLLILALLVANVAATSLRHPERSAAESLGKTTRARELATLDRRSFVAARRDSSTAVGMTEEHLR